MPPQTLNTIFEKLGGVEAGVREAKHATNNTSAKVDTLSGKVDALALVVATQGHLKEDVERLEDAAKENRRKIENLEADKLRRDGAIGLVEWVGKNYPVLILVIGLVLFVAYANGLLR